MKLNVAFPVQPAPVTLTMTRRLRLPPVLLTPAQIAVECAALPLWAWFRAHGKPPRRVRIAALPMARVEDVPGAPLSYRGNHCTDCGSPISPYSRGRCRRCGYSALVRPVPEDFMVILRQLGSQGAARHYRASLATVTRWRRELDIRPQVRAKKGIGQSRYRGFTERPLMQHRDLSQAGQAAEYLRRYGAVYRCDEEGRPNAKGSHWRRNFSVLGDDDVVRQATRLGWRPVEL